jgi:hypothetical protein
LQLHFHGPLPETAEAVPTLHRPVVGLLLKLSPFAGPQAPLTVTGPAELTGSDELPVVPLLEALPELDDAPELVPFEPEELELPEPDCFCSICWICRSSCWIICLSCCKSCCSICP